MRATRPTGYRSFGRAAFAALSTTSATALGWSPSAGTLQIARATPDRAASDAILEAGVRAAIRLAK
jgi:hypothetical protein